MLIGHCCPNPISGFSYRRRQSRQFLTHCIATQVPLCHRWQQTALRLRRTHTHTHTQLSIVRVLLKWDSVRLEELAENNSGPSSDPCGTSQSRVVTDDERRTGFILALDGGTEIEPAATRQRCPEMICQYIAAECVKSGRCVETVAF